MHDQANQESIMEHYSAVRQQSIALCRGLHAEDMTPQSMPDASPIKWHLAHTTWFFETFLLMPQLSGYRNFDESYQYLFNSYYESVGKQYSRPERGLITRPTVDQVFAYREYVDTAMLALLDQNHSELNELVTVGLHHEMQHQELMLTDLLHLFSLNPSFPIAMSSVNETGIATRVSELSWSDYDGGLFDAGASNDRNTDGASEGISYGSSNDFGYDFSYDCERPQHQSFLTPFRIANRTVTNGEWLQFMDDNAYSNSLLWLSDGWAARNRTDWRAPAYWHKRNEQWHQFGLDGLKALDLNAPVSHISYYEAQAFATWSGKRLPREHELEFCAQATKIHGNFVEQKNWRPQAINSDAPTGLQQLYGDVWEWTQSAYLPYPKFKAENGALGEYNGKFMANQFVLKGGSCATAKAQMRASYRNFFYPHQRWQFSGLRLAEDI
jgi:ergothioneine biosynthesis protein EgtB